MDTLKTIKIGVLEIPNLILWGESADFIRTGLNDYISLQQNLNFLQQGVPLENIAGTLPIIEKFTKIQGEFLELKAITNQTEAQKQRFTALNNEMIPLLARLNEQAPEMLERSKGLKQEQKDTIKKINNQRITLRDGLLKDICENVEPHLDFEVISKKLTALQKEKLIYETIKEPENNIDVAFLTQMEMITPQVTSPANL